MKRHMSTISVLLASGLALPASGEEMDMDRTRIERGPSKTIQGGMMTTEERTERENRMVFGRVVDVRPVQLEGVPDRHQLVKIERDGKRIIVNLGTEEEQGWIADLEPGDLLFASGRSARINGRPVLMAKWAAEVKAVGHGVTRQGQ